MRKKLRNKAAVALKYTANKDSAPRVVAKGYGSIAEKIIDIAKKNNITLYDDPDLIEILSEINLNAEIPSSVYKVVAEIFSFVYSVNSKYPKK